ncbi:LutB/LldF family L-lactate oxidation iron-sulfur protein [Thermobacillus sp. ZCTH02-B1]|uniref:LutB/LldF family L-lactate oxidation iron-sulfur protein n=1 Tax=Thermobacillus sp. ZCTH02-B1 TaxID=1858795 RepID=UPI0025F533A1|nr:LutB/LldF family L-lactate oxidation iron-sulfur protein [Thermobacillus sp. ZCTH02-B1]
MSSEPQGTVKERAEAALANDFLRQAVRFTTEKLRTGRRQAAEEHGNWEIWRERGRQIRQHTVAHLDYYLNRFAENARANGAQVHFARTADEAVRIVQSIARRVQAKTVVKSKSMVTEELHLNRALAEIGVKAIETDLGEYIIQLAGEAPSHIIIPAIHKNRGQIAELLSKEAGEKLPPDTKTLAGFVRRRLREAFLTADIGMTGCNFAVAETGSICIFENEGNARMVSTVPKVQITLMGMERIVPTWADLEVMATLLPRSATGQKLTVYLSGISGPRRPGDADGPEELHIVIVDNGRSNQLGDPEFQELLHCIRCGACLNVCPVYRHIGGHAYGGTYSGPIGAVLTPALKRNVAEWDDIANASSLCGACWEACPVKIPLHDMLVYLRRRKAESPYRSAGEAAAMKAYGLVMARPERLSAALKLARLGQRFAGRDGEIRARIGPLGGWTRHRALPMLPAESFRDRWKKMRPDGDGPLDPDVEERLRAALAERYRNGRAAGAAAHPEADRGSAENAAGCGAAGGQPAIGGQPAAGAAAGPAGGAYGPSPEPADVRSPGTAPMPDDQRAMLGHIAHRLCRPLTAAPEDRTPGAPPFWRMFELPPEERRGRFADHFRAAGGHVAIVPDLRAAARYIAEQAAARGATRLLLQDAPELTDGLALERAMPDARLVIWNRDPAKDWIAEAAAADAGVVLADWAAAYTGTVVLLSSKERGRAVSLLPPALFVVLPAERIRTRLGEIFEAFDRGGRSAMPAGVHLVSGPSRSADIENDLTIGVHGPGDVHAIIVGADG